MKALWLPFVCPEDVASTSDMSVVNVAVVGGGLAGLSFAAALVQVGISCFSSSHLQDHVVSGPYRPELR